ncbi:hypothetical protein QBZ16_000368 [Prototheca wickerhamii]|uniref:DNA-directed DNA polymerase family A palm domain-containing protein n=1 Tax=Prototheca wickerhamii TaxID=3111 RepID=A0AAD9IN27_PROWI|nr:hypothetical protein QBZ16_000368 [Prototheca wickerhamii]
MGGSAAPAPGGPSHLGGGAHRHAHLSQVRDPRPWALPALADHRTVIEQTRNDLRLKNLRNEASSKSLERKLNQRRASELRSSDFRPVSVPEEFERGLGTEAHGAESRAGGLEQLTAARGTREADLNTQQTVGTASPAFLERQRELHALVPNTPPEDVLVVNTLSEARRVASMLMAPAMADLVFACDTEVAEIDVSSQSPCCHGRLICFSVHAGPGTDFSADGSGRPTLWVDTYLDGDSARQDEARKILDAFAPFFASASRRKVWHNFSFDRHIVERAGLRHGGFEADTMHMARLLDSSRKGKLNYSLESLSTDETIMSGHRSGSAGGGLDESLESLNGSMRSLGLGEAALPPSQPSTSSSLALYKVGMKDLFARPNVRADGTMGKLQAETRWRWVRYAATDAKATWELYEALKAKLQATTGVWLDPAVAQEYADAGTVIRNLWDVYREFWRPFGALLTEMEAAGVAVDRARLAEAQRRAETDQEAARERFRRWAVRRVPDAAHMNVSSAAQVGQLLFAGVPNGKDPGAAGVPLLREFKVPNALGISTEPGKKPKKHLAIRLHGVWGEGVPSPLQPSTFTPSGLPGCSTAVLKALAGPPGRAARALAEKYPLDEAEADAAVGLAELVDDGLDEDPGVETVGVASAGSSPTLPSEELIKLGAAAGYGALFPLFGSEEEGLRACAAVDALVDVGAVDTLLSNFILPLQQDAIAKPGGLEEARAARAGRPEPLGLATGRLSARRPNLQNQPALEKDRYGVRRAFTADVAAGHTLVVADYGQLELRLLAHMARCASMIAAFEAGGDFHSRTALGMYDHVRAAVDSGAVLLEWDGGADGRQPPPRPLLKDAFSSERRRAKVLNFSIAYGKTAHGLARDWGVSVDEARDTVERWYADRPEGSAADVAASAMLRIARDARLAELGWVLLLQVHDEVILEGPRESADEARERVVACMRSPFTGASTQPLLVDLVVDAKHADTWYDAK